MARQLPAQEERVETGAIQFGNDAPGFFFRGVDTALLEKALRIYLETQAERYARPDEQSVYTCLDRVRKLIHDEMKGDSVL